MVILLNKILRNHLLSENMQWNYVSFKVTLNYPMHEIMEFCVTSSLALDNWEQKYCQTLDNNQTIHTVCCEDDYSLVCFTKCTLSKKFVFYLKFVICGTYETKINAVLWHSARQILASLGLFTFERIACQLQLWIKTSELDYSIWTTPK